MQESAPPELRIARVALPVPLYRVFDYLIPADFELQKLQPGIRVKVPFGRNSMTGVLLSVHNKTSIPPDKLKPLSALLDSEPLLTPADIELLHWASRYYYHAPGEVFAQAFPNALRKGKVAELKNDEIWLLTEQGQHCTPEQLARAPKQQQLLSYLQAQAPNGASLQELRRQFPDASNVLKTLLAKNLLTRAPAEATLQVSTLPLLQAALVPNAEQLQAITTVCHALGQFQVFLLEGVTGSGKTEVYLQVIQQVLAKGQQVLVLLPEITLTPQLEARFKRRFAVTITTSHSKLTENQRQRAWMQMQQGAARILLGTRSALFTPLKNPGLIILDEEHDSSFKQQEGFRYSTRDVAIMRAKSLQIPVILGSATPALESYANVQRGRFQLLQLTQRAGQAADPRILIIDVRNKPLQQGLSPPLLQAINDTLAKNEQVLLFLNRRGFAPLLMCHGCGWVARCPSCDANLVVHFAKQQLRCHHCGFEQASVKLCPLCKTGETFPLGLGTERVEAVLSSLFPDKRILRLDRDTTQRKGVLEDYLQQIHQQQVDIILGTQMLAKGHHFPNVTLVALLDVDSGLFSIDFHAPEKLAQLIVQVAGRAGRADKPGQVMLQTRQPEHPLLLTLIREGYHHFAQQALAERHAAGLPPFSFQALIRVVATNVELAVEFLHQVQQFAQPHASENLLILGPAPAPMAKRANQFHYQILLQAERRMHLRQVLDALIPYMVDLPLAKKLRWSVDVDPVDLY